MDRNRMPEYGMEDLIRSYITVFGVRTIEVGRATRELAALARSLEMRVHVYNPGEGLDRGEKKWVSMDAVQVLDEILAAHVRSPGSAEDILWILQLYHPFLRDPDPVVLSRLRTLHDRARYNGTAVLILEPRFQMPAELRDLPVLDFPLPDQEARKRLVESDVEEYAEEERNEIARSLSGFTEKEAESVLSLSLLRAGRLDPALIRAFREQAIKSRAGSSIEFVSPLPGCGLEQVGGMEGLIGWLRTRQTAFLEPGRLLAYGLSPPRGILLFGVPGCGKTLVAKALAGSWGVPLLKMNAARLYTAEVGGSETRLYEALETARAMAPCILLVDEIEKGFAPVSSFSDGGIALRIQGALLDFLQECADRVFVVGTCNGVAEMMPELLRRGRWDEIFFVDLPDERERLHIFEVLFRRYRVASEAGPDCAKATEGFSGAEIEQAIRDTLYSECIHGGRPFHSLALLRHIKRLVPLSRLREREVRALRQWASERALFANGTRGLGRRNPDRNP
jgi:AAA+ superfamily predicted ATPase